MKKFLVLILVFFSAVSVFAENEVSSYTEQLVLDFVTLRVSLKSVPDEEALKIIDEVRTKAFAGLEKNAVDYEQEKLMLENLYFMESYEHLYSTEKRAELRKEVKTQMKKSHALLEKRKESQIDKWYYVLCGDVTNYYMTRSVAACFFYGFKVKAWYKKAVEKDKYMTAANASLGNWNFYAPAPIGSNRKAGEYYKNAIKGAKTAGEKYMAYEYYSQFCYEENKKDEAAEYLAMAYDLNLGTKELDRITLCNESGISYLQWLRNRSGVDEKIPESEKESED